MSYQAIVTTVKLRPHPNADKLNLAEVAGHQLVCAKDAYEDGDTVIFFPEGGQLSNIVCWYNDLYRENKGENRTPGVYGYFGENRRVRSIKLRGEISEGFMLPLDGLKFVSSAKPLDELLRPGMLIDSVLENEICRKYETPATKQARQKAGGQARKDINNFAKIGDTPKFRYMLPGIPAGALLTVSEKIHGTSGRTGNINLLVKVPTKENALQRAWRWFLRKPIPVKTVRKYQYVSGSRRMIIAQGEQVPGIKPDGEEIPLGYRQEIHNSLIGCLRLGEAIYYEIVVVNDQGTSEFHQKIGNNKSDAVLRSLGKKYGERMEYLYNVPPGTWKIWIYRITMQNEQGDAVPLSYNAMRARALQLGVDTVPVLEQFIYDGDSEKLNERLASISDGPSTLDSTHIREGLAVHVDAPTMQTVVKRKGFAFCHLEGIAKNDENYVDPEEIA